MRQGADGDQYREDEPEYRRIDRHWNELLQELRVVQAGVQILAGLLFTVPFQAAFSELDATQRAVYLVGVSLATFSAVLLIAPVAFHRALFRRQLRPELIRMSNRVTKLGLAALALCLSAVLGLVFDVVAGRAAGIAASAVGAALFVTLWLILPLRSAGNAPEWEE